MYAIARSAHWYLPNRHGDRNSAPYSETVKSIYRTFPFIQRLARNLLYLQAETAWPIFPQKNQWIRKGNEKVSPPWDGTDGRNCVNGWMKSCQRSTIPSPSQTSVRSLQYATDNSHGIETLRIRRRILYRPQPR